MNKCNFTSVGNYHVPGAYTLRLRIHNYLYMSLIITNK